MSVSQDERLSRIEFTLQRLESRLCGRGHSKARDGRAVLAVRVGDELAELVRRTARQRGCTIADLLRPAILATIAANQDAPCSGAKCVRMEVLLTPARGTSISEITVIGLDLAKRVFQVHGADREGRPVLRKRLQRSQVLDFFANLSPCLIGLEACADRTTGGAS